MKKELTFVEKAFYNTFDLDVVYDMTDIFERATFVMLLSLANHYFDTLRFIYTRNYRHKRAKQLVHMYHDICAYQCNAIDFMLLCDVLNTLNKALNLDIVYDFDDYNDIENTCLYERNNETMYKKAKYNAFYNYDYSYINVMKYAMQYEELYY